MADTDWGVEISDKSVGGVKVPPHVLQKMQDLAEEHTGRRDLKIKRVPRKSIVLGRKRQSNNDVPKA